MEFGVHFAPTAEATDVRALGRLVEAAGFESLFLPEHTHLPADGASVHPSGPQMHDRLRRFLEPLIALTAIAGATRHLRLGTCVCLIAQHDPITLAKQVATLDLLSGGRVLFGIGAGWNREELRHHGTDPATRWRVMRERPLWQWPKPMQHPHPPVLGGGERPGVFDRVLEYGDEWAPNAEAGIAERCVPIRRASMGEAAPDLVRCCRKNERLQGAQGRHTREYPRL